MLQSSLVTPHLLLLHVDDIQFLISTHFKGVSDMLILGTWKDINS